MLVRSRGGTQTSQNRYGSCFPWRGVRRAVIKKLLRTDFAEVVTPESSGGGGRCYLRWKKMEGFTLTKLITLILYSNSTRQQFIMKFPTAYSETEKKIFTYFKGALFSHFRRLPATPSLNGLLRETPSGAEGAFRYELKRK